MTDDRTPRAAPQGRLTRMLRLGGLAGGIGGGALATGARQLATGQRPRAQRSVGRDEHRRDRRRT